MNLAGVDLNLLVALDALLDERSVTRAANRVGLSQPGMSNTLARLRKLFGDPLLVREGLTLVPTPRAESLRQPVQDALNLIQHALDDRDAFDPASAHATFTVSCSDYSILMLIGPLVRRLTTTAPGLTVQVVPRAADAVRLLRDGDADLVIEPVEIIPDVTLPRMRLFTDRWLCCVWDGTQGIRPTRRTPGSASASRRSRRNSTGLGCRSAGPGR
jgi:LysR family transcriptional regulator, nod-box dependent transcriptional activator